jgi:hypothetical protein
VLIAASLLFGAERFLAPRQCPELEVRRISEIPSSSWPGLSRPSINAVYTVSMDGRHKGGHDEFGGFRLASKASAIAFGEA